MAPGTELVFNDGFNILLGKNGTGKTTLLRLIAMVVTGKFEHLKDDDFGLEYELTVAGLRIVSTIRNEPRKHQTATANPVEKVPIGTSLQSEPTWSCEFRVLLEEESSTRNLCAISIDPLRAILRFAEKDHPIPVQSPFEQNPLDQSLLRLMSIIQDSLHNSSESPVADYLLVAVRLLDAIRMNGGRFDEALGALNAITAALPPGDAGDIDIAVLCILEDTRLTTRFSHS